VKRGFTMIELMTASTISIIVLTAVVGMITATWSLMRDSTDELQAMLRMRYQRTRLLYSASKEGYGGLLSVTKIGLSSQYLGLTFANGKTSTAELKEFGLNTGDDAYHNKTMADPITGMQAGMGDYSGMCYVFLTSSCGRTIVYDRMIVPLFGRQPKPDAEDHGGFKVRSDLFRGELAPATSSWVVK